MLNCFPSRVRAALRRFEIFGEWGVIFVSSVGFDSGRNRFLGDEAGDVVDMAVGIVAGTASV